jgi:carbon storage regulator
MLVLRRKVGEAIVLNGVITVYVLAVEGERVKLGINAPPDVVIVRQELLDAVSQENRAARKQAQGGEGEGESGSGRSGQESSAEGTSGRRDLRAMLNRALSTPDGTLPPRNGYTAELPIESSRLQNRQPAPPPQQGQPEGPEDDTPDGGQKRA